MSSRWKTSIVLIILAGLSAWFLNILLEDEIIEARSPRHDPDYYMENFSTTTMEEDGSPKNKLSAKYMAHYPDENTIELINPHLEIYQQDNLPINVTAEKGWVTADNEVILLSGNVKLWQDNQQGERVLEVISSDVKILTKLEYAETNNYTTINARNMTASAIGVRAYFQDKKLELLSNVHGIFDQKKVN